MKAFIRLFLLSLIRLCYRMAPDMFPRKSELVRQVKENLALQHELESAREDMLTLARAVEEHHRQHLILANEIVAKHDEIKSLRLAAAFDPLTGLYNRRGADAALEHTLGVFKRRDHTASGEVVRHHLSVLMMDLNNFKAVNDTYGHDAGDAVLVAVAEHLKHSFRPEDIVFRKGGDEFVVYLVNASKGNAVGSAERFRQRLEEDPHLRFGAIQVSVSIGISHGSFTTGRGGLQKISKIEKSADTAMYAAKQESRAWSGIIIAADVEYSDTDFGSL